MNKKKKETNQIEKKLLNINPSENILDEFQKKKENCGKLTETCGESKISFSIFPYDFDIFSGLSHFVVTEQWCQGAM